MKFSVALAAQVDAFLDDAARSDFTVFQRRIFPTVSAENYLDAVHLRIIAAALQRVVGAVRLVGSSPSKPNPAEI